MTRKRIISDVFPYHVSGRCNNSDWYSLDLSVVWMVFEKQLKKMKRRDNVNIHHFVLMNNHYHMIISTPNLNLGQAMCNFQRDVSKELNLLSQKQDHVQGKRFFSCVLEQSFHYLIVLKYIYRNPIRANLCKNAEDYEFSTITKKSEVFELSSYDHQLCVFKNNDSTLNWLNEPFNIELEDIIKKSLRKNKFKLPLRIKRNKL